MHNFDLSLSRKGTGCVKWDSLKKVFGRDEILPFWVADMDFAVPPGVTEALAARASHPVYGYHTHSPSLFEAVIDWQYNRHGWSVKREWLLSAPGVVPSLSMAILALTEPEDQIIIQPPVYPPFFSCITKNNRQIVENPLVNIDGLYVPDFEDLEKKINPRVKMLVLCSPHNPVGRVWTKAELLRLADICLRHNIIIVSDEIHCDLVYSAYKHLPLSALGADIAQNTVTLISPSKTFNIAGTYTSFAVIPNQSLRAKISRLMDALSIGSGNLFGLVAAEAAYRTGGEWLDELLSYLEKNAGYLVDFIREEIPAINTYLPQGTYLAWLDFANTAIPASELNAFLVHQAGLGLNDGTTFGPQGAGFARFNFACSRALLAEGLTRLKAAVKL